MKTDNEKTATEVTTEPKVTAKPEATAEIVSSSRAVDPAEVEKAIRTSVYTAAGIGIVPMPLFNTAAVTASNLNLARKLANIYGVEFKEGVAKKIIASIIGAGAGVLASPFVESVVSLVPVIGLPLTIGTKPALNATTTYALGRMFVTHFERGGSFVGANANAMKEDFKDAFKNSREWLGDAIKGTEKAPQAANV